MWKCDRIGLYSAVHGLNVDRQCPLAFQSGAVAGVMGTGPSESTAGHRRGEVSGRILNEELSHLRSRLTL